MPRHDSDSDEEASAPKPVKQEEGKALVKKETLEVVGLDGDQALQADDKEYALRTGGRGIGALCFRSASGCAAPPAHTHAVCIHAGADQLGGVQRSWRGWTRRL